MKQKQSSYLLALWLCITIPFPETALPKGARGTSKEGDKGWQSIAMREEELTEPMSSSSDVAGILQPDSNDLIQGSKKEEGDRRGKDKADKDTYEGSMPSLNWQPPCRDSQGRGMNTPETPQYSR